MRKSEMLGQYPKKCQRPLRKVTFILKIKFKNFSFLTNILDLITTLEGERLGKKPLIELLIIYVNFPERSWRLAFTNELEILSWK